MVFCLSLHSASIGSLGGGPQSIAVGFCRFYRLLSSTLRQGDFLLWMGVEARPARKLRNLMTKYPFSHHINSHEFVQGSYSKECQRWWSQIPWGPKHHTWWFCLNQSHLAWHCYYYQKIHLMVSNLYVGFYSRGYLCNDILEALVISAWIFSKWHPLPRNPSLLYIFWSIRPYLHSHNTPWRWIFSYHLFAQSSQHT